MEETLKERFEKAKNEIAVRAGFQNFKHFEQNGSILQRHVDAFMTAAYNMALPQWVRVVCDEEVPVGEWLFALDTDKTRKEVQSGYKTENNIIVIGSCFAWDMPKIIAYQPLPTPPNPKDQPLKGKNKRYEKLR